jgi:hypothetical protein
LIIAVGIVYLFAMVIGALGKVQMEYNNNPHLHGEQQLNFDQNGVSGDIIGDNRTLRWDACSGILETDESIIFAVQKKMVLVVPKRILVGSQLDQLRGIFTGSGYAPQQ